MNKKNKQEKLQRLKEMLIVVNDPHVKKAVKDKVWLELWNDLENPVGKIVNQTISKYYHQDRPSSDLVNDAVLESILWVITNSSSWDPKRGAGVATWSYQQSAAITRAVVGFEHVTLDIDESTEDGALKKQELEMLLLDESVAGRTSGTTYAGDVDVDVEHPFDQLASLENPVVSLLLDALQYLLSRGLITDDAATICAERVTGTEYSIISDYFGKTEVAIRKISQRTNQHLKTLNIEMPRYADLIKLPMIAAVVNGKASKKEI